MGNNYHRFSLSATISLQCSVLIVQYRKQRSHKSVQQATPTKWVKNRKRYFKTQNNVTKLSDPTSQHTCNICYLKSNIVSRKKVYLQARIAPSPFHHSKLSHLLPSKFTLFQYRKICSICFSQTDSWLFLIKPMPDRILLAPEKHLAVFSLPTFPIASENNDLYICLYKQYHKLAYQGNSKLQKPLEHFIKQEINNRNNTQRHEGIVQFTNFSWYAPLNSQ